MILLGDCRDVLKTLPDKSVHCCVTSPPYWGLRNYGVAGQIGLEKTPDEYVATMVQVFREVKRVLRDDGTLWLNLGDSYISNPGDRAKVGGFQGKANQDRIDAESSMSMNKHNCGLKPKDLCGIPWRVAFALQADGWYLRSDIIWHKPNPMPESVTDRPTKSHEYVFLMSKSARYFYDAEAVKEKIAESTINRVAVAASRNPGAGYQNKERVTDGYKRCATARVSRDMYSDPRDHLVCAPTGNGRNLRSVWTIATQPSSEPHFAMFPEALVVPCIKAGTSEHGVCPECGAPWERVVGDDGPREKIRGAGASVVDSVYGAVGRTSVLTTGEIQHKKTLGFRPTCKCGREDRVQATVLDPFSGMATVGVVCNKLGRKYTGIELNPKYAGRSGDRKDKAANMFSEIV